MPHDYFHATQKDLRENTEEGRTLSMKELKSLCKTRWCSQAEACDAVVATLGSVIKSVEHFADDDYPERRATAQLLWVSLIRISANYLQSKDIDTS